jgi:isoleucyl-tRNA synthetase
MIELNKTINWKPAATGTGRFGNWLENLVDWNLSRSRFWGTPLPIWVTEDREEKKCIGSARELKEEIAKSIESGFMNEDPMKDFVPGDMSEENYNTFDLHRPYVDKIVLVSDSGKKMLREPCRMITTTPSTCTGLMLIKSSWFQIPERKCYANRT